MSERGQELLDLLPPYEQSDPNVQAVQDVVGREFARIEAHRAAMLRTVHPATADDTYGGLSLWESTLGLPIAPPGASLDARRSRVKSALLATSAGADWEAAIGEAAATESWAYTEEPGYLIVITVPWGAGTYQFGSVEQLARRITPAHLNVIVTTGTGFILGQSQLGLDRL
jgi:hypothetical protein